MARLKRQQSELIKVRNDLIIQCIRDGKLNQSEIAFIFRLPRNTVSLVKRHGN